MAWASAEGFQAGSTKMTRSAPVTQRPVPPTCMLRPRMAACSVTCSDPWLTIQRQGPNTERSIENLLAGTSAASHRGPTCCMQVDMSETLRTPANLPCALGSMLPSMRRNLRPRTLSTQPFRSRKLQEHVCLHRTPQSCLDQVEHPNALRKDQAAMASFRLARRICTLLRQIRLTIAALASSLQLGEQNGEHPKLCGEQGGTLGRVRPRSSQSLSIEGRSGPHGSWSVLRVENASSQPLDVAESLSAMHEVSEEARSTQVPLPALAA